MYVCSCFGITEAQVRQHAADGRGTPRAIAGACRAGSDCGSCVKRIQALLGRTAPAAAPVAAVPCPVHPFPAREVAEAPAA